MKTTSSRFSSAVYVQCVPTGWPRYAGGALSFCGPPKDSRSVFSSCDAGRREQTSSVGAPYVGCDNQKVKANRTTTAAKSLVFMSPPRQDRDPEVLLFVSRLRQLIFGTSPLRSGLVEHRRCCYASPHQGQT